QGLQNSELVEIVEFCKGRGIVVIEDLAHCCDVDWRLAGDFGIFSYAFDKPLSSWRGGALKIAEGSSRNDVLRSLHAELPIEPVGAAAADLAELRRVFKMVSQLRYVGMDLSPVGTKL